jgi:hypothetical protein
MVVSDNLDVMHGSHIESERTLQNLRRSRKEFVLHPEIASNAIIDETSRKANERAGCGIEKASILLGDTQPSSFIGHQVGRNGRRARV